MKRIVIGVLGAGLLATLLLVPHRHPRTQAKPQARVVSPIDRASDSANIEYLANIVRQEGPGAAHAAAAIARIHDTTAAPALTALARDEHGSVLLRANAIHALAACEGDPGLLVELATDVKQPARIRQEAALALRVRGTALHVPVLAASLDREQDEQIRISLIQALKAINSADARAAIAHHAQRQLSATERAFVDAKG